MDPTVNQRLFTRESDNFNLIHLQATMRGFDKLIRKTFENLTRNSNAMLGTGKRGGELTKRVRRI